MNNKDVHMPVGEPVVAPRASTSFMVLLHYHEKDTSRQRYIFTVGQPVAYPVEFRCLTHKVKAGGYKVDLVEPLGPIPILVSSEKERLSQLICQVLGQRLGVHVRMGKGSLGEYHTEMGGNA